MLRRILPVRNSTSYISAVIVRFNLSCISCKNGVFSESCYADVQNLGVNSRFQTRGVLIKIYREISLLKYRYRGCTYAFVRCGHSYSVWGMGALGAECLHFSSNSSVHGPLLLLHNSFKVASVVTLTTCYIVLFILNMQNVFCYRSVSQWDWNRMIAPSPIKSAWRPQQP